MTSNHVKKLKRFVKMSALSGKVPFQLIITNG